MTDIAISIENVTKTYRLYETPGDRVKELFHPFRKTYHHSFNALSGVTFQIKQGDAFGVIGRNGSGKSTLLQIITGIMQPSQGDVLVNGRVAALLELGAGFNPEFTGRENVFMNGAILGFSHEEMAGKFDQIASFADIGEFLEQPVKTYSSGMYVRLAFAVQACVEPEILIVDEALSVGDVFFQQKCLRRMRELRDKGVTLLFVSHDMATVRDLCDNSLYLKRGEAVFVGPSYKAIQLYIQEDIVESSTVEPPSDTFSENDPLHLPDKFNGIIQNAIWSVGGDSLWDRSTDAQIVAVSVLNKNGESCLNSEIGGKLLFRIYYQQNVQKPVHVSLTMKNRYDQVINSTGSYVLGVEPFAVESSDILFFELEMVCDFESGQYTFLAELSYAGAQPNRGVVLNETPWLGPLTITWDYENKMAPFLGMFHIPVEGCFEKVCVNKDLDKGN
jgi:homopolymeric O-antigen transport system ATP-binding protein